jgi:hypothetical protein
MAEHTLAILCSTINNALLEKNHGDLLSHRKTWRTATQVKPQGGAANEEGLR